MALALAEGGEIVSCDSLQVYRGLDIGSAKPSREEQSSVRHHLIDVVDADQPFSAADYARLARAAIADIRARGRLPIVAGGTGFYYRALTRGLFPGPGRDADLRARLEAIAGRRGPERLHRLLHRVDAESARRIQPRDTKRMVRAIEVYFLTGRPLTDHFADTEPPLPDAEFIAVAVKLPAAAISERVTRRVDEQFERGLLAEIRGLLACGIPESARPFGGLVYRQALEHLHAVRDEAATRALISQENRHYARRQLIWFRKEPGLTWFDGPGESAGTMTSVLNFLDARLQRRT